MTDKLNEAFFMSFPKPTKARRLLKEDYEDDIPADILDKVEIKLEPASKADLINSLEDFGWGDEEIKAEKKLWPAGWCSKARWEEYANKSEVGSDLLPFDELLSEYMSIAADEADMWTYDYDIESLYTLCRRGKVIRYTGDMKALKKLAEDSDED